jgi:hypothetical protein
MNELAISSKLQRQPIRLQDGCEEPEWRVPRAGDLRMIAASLGQ